MAEEKAFDTFLRTQIDKWTEDENASDSIMNLIEGWGTGIPRLFREMKEYGLAEPEFIDMELALRINLYRTQTSEETSEETGEETSEEMKRDILFEIKENPAITQKQLAAKVGLSYSGIRYVMKQLQEEGALKRTGSTKKGQWIVLQKSGKA